MVDALGEPGLVVVDEIQRVPSLLNTVQSIADRTSHRFVLTGSSARKLRHGGANLLPGRVVLERLDPLSVLELDRPLDLDRALRAGMLPGIYWGDEEAAEVLGTYADVYLREEIQAESAARDIGSYARFLDVVAVASGQWLNYSKLSSDSEIPKETIRRFVQVLEDTMVAVRIPAFVPGVGTRRRVRQRERVLLFDVGVRNALLGIHRRPITADQLGAVFEQWVVLQAVYINNALRKGWALSAYHSEGGAEVDLVVSTPDATIGIEIKASRNVSPRDARGLRSLAELVDDTRPFRKWIVYRGERRQRLADGTEVWPVLEALTTLAEVPAS